MNQNAQKTNNFETEVHVIGSILCGDMDIYDLLRTTCPANRASCPEHAVIISAINEMHAAKEQIDVITLALHLDKSGLHLEAGGIHHLAHLAQIVANKKQEILTDEPDTPAGGIKLTEEDLNAIRSTLFSALFDGDPPKITRAPGEYWLARTTGDGNVFLQRFCTLSKTPIESYRHASGDAALLDLAAISLGYQPPRALHHLDIPAAETPCE